MHIFVHMCFCTSSLWFSCGQEQHGPVALPGRWACSWVRVLGDRGLGRVHPTRAAVPHCPSKDSRADLVTVTRVSWESSECQASPQGWDRSKVRLGSQAKGSESPNPAGWLRQGGARTWDEASPSSFSCSSLHGPQSTCSWVGWGKRLQNLVMHSESWRLWKNVELFQIVSEGPSQSLWKSSYSHLRWALGQVLLARSQGAGVS